MWWFQQAMIPVGVALVAETAIYYLRPAWLAPLVRLPALTRTVALKETLAERLVVRTHEGAYREGPVVAWDPELVPVAEDLRLEDVVVAVPGGFVVRARHRFMNSIQAIVHVAVHPAAGDVAFVARWAPAPGVTTALALCLFVGTYFSVHDPMYLACSGGVAIGYWFQIGRSRAWALEQAEVVSRKYLAAVRRRVKATGG